MPVHPYLIASIFDYPYS